MQEQDINSINQIKFDFKMPNIYTTPNTYTIKLDLKFCNSYKIKFEDASNTSFSIYENIKYNDNDETLSASVSMVDDYEKYIKQEIFSEKYKSIQKNNIINMPINLNNDQNNFQLIEAESKTQANLNFIGQKDEKNIVFGAEYKDLYITLDEAQAQNKNNLNFIGQKDEKNIVFGGDVSNSINLNNEENKDMHISLDESQAHSDIHLSGKGSYDASPSVDQPE